MFLGQPLPPQSLYCTPFSAPARVSFISSFQRVTVEHWSPSVLGQGSLFHCKPLSLTWLGRQVKWRRRSAYHRFNWRCCRRRWLWSTIQRSFCSFILWDYRLTCSHLRESKQLHAFSNRAVLLKIRAWRRSKAENLWHTKSILGLDTRCTSHKRKLIIRWILWKLLLFKGIFKKKWWATGKTQYLQRYNW